MENLIKLLFKDGRDHKLTSGFGYADPEYPHGYHRGVDFRAVVGSSVHATHDFEVLETNSNPKASDYGNFTWLYLPQLDYSMLLAHGSRTVVSKGQKGKKGEQIYITGNSGVSEAPHLHIGIKKGRTTSRLRSDWINPILLVKVGVVKDTDVDFWRKSGGVFKITVKEGVKERATPSTSGKHIRSHAQGAELKYTDWGNSKKYTWFKLTNGNYVAFGERGIENYGKDYPGVTSTTVAKPKPVAPSKHRPSGNWKPQNGVFILDNKVGERNEPTVRNNKGFKWRYKGEELPYNAYLIQGGYVWLRQGSSGKVIPWRVHNGETWGKLV